MFVCHCKGITDTQIRQAVQDLHAESPGRVITPSSVLRKLGKRPECGGCLPLFLRTMKSGPAVIAPDRGTIGLCCETVKDLGLVCPVTHHPCGES